MTLSYHQMTMKIQMAAIFKSDHRIKSTGVWILVKNETKIKIIRNPEKQLD